MRIAIGSDHRGYQLKQEIIGFLKETGYDVEDFGAFTEDSADYPDYAHVVGNNVAAGSTQYGILVCGTGIGMCISVNKVPGVRGAVCRNVFEAQRSRQHNDANVVCLGADITDQIQAFEIIRTFLDTPFEGGRHQRRLDKIRGIEKYT